MYSNMALSTPGNSKQTFFPTSVWKFYTSMLHVWDKNCTSNCSGHGECYNGTCLCEVQFRGEECTQPNMAYYIGFALIFYSICIVSLIQLFLCINAEFHHMKRSSIKKACKITVQKFLYILTFLAAALRGIYYSSPNWSQEHKWFMKYSGLSSAFYPVVLTGASLLVCFWAEVFHSEESNSDKPRFLNKSFVGFVIFNTINYSPLLIQVCLNYFMPAVGNEMFFITRLFSGCYAVLVFIVVIFFLVYGVEVYFKVRGGFTNGMQIVDVNQLHQSRFGLIFQALMLLTIAGCLCSDLLSGFWRNKYATFAFCINMCPFCYRVSLVSRNFHHIFFRTVELAVALWFPCVLWNCISPNQLWILNPKRILRKLDLSKIEIQGGDNLENKNYHDSNELKAVDCWICYDTERLDAGPLIQPCNCRGDVSVVHHDCLQKWLIESAENKAKLHCQICKEPYKLKKSYPFLSQSLPCKQWIQTFGLVTLLCAALAVGWFFVQFYEETEIRLVGFGISLVIIYICMRFLGFNMVNAYHRTRLSAYRIIGQKIRLPSLSSNVDVKNNVIADLSFT